MSAIVEDDLRWSGRHERQLCGCTPELESNVIVELVIVAVAAVSNAYGTSPASDAPSVRMRCV
jgi:hypothetical protein